MLDEDPEYEMAEKKGLSRWKNYWLRKRCDEDDESCDPYDGADNPYHGAEGNWVFTDQDDNPDGEKIVFELQFHTQNSLSGPDTSCAPACGSMDVKFPSHVLYGKSRLMAKGPKKQALIDQAKSMWRKVDFPEGVESLGKGTKLERMKCSSVDPANAKKEIPCTKAEAWTGDGKPESEADPHRQKQKNKSFFQSEEATKFEELNAKLEAAEAAKAEANERAAAAEKQAERRIQKEEKRLAKKQAKPLKAYLAECSDEQKKRAKAQFEFNMVTDVQLKRWCELDE